MELKFHTNNGRSLKVGEFKSHLYGIEIIVPNKFCRKFVMFKSHLYGIEILLSHAHELQSQKFKSHLYGIEMILLALKLPRRFV